jgi:hypothetical protein
MAANSDTPPNAPLAPFRCGIALADGFSAPAPELCAALAPPAAFEAVFAPPAPAAADDSAVTVDFAIGPPGADAVAGAPGVSVGAGAEKPAPCEAEAPGVEKKMLGAPTVVADGIASVPLPVLPPVGVAPAAAPETVNELTGKSSELQASSISARARETVGGGRRREDRTYVREPAGPG